MWMGPGLAIGLGELTPSPSQELDDDRDLIVVAVDNKVASLILNHSLVAHQHEQQAQGLGKANQDKTDSYC